LGQQRQRVSRIRTIYSRAYPVNELFRRHHSPTRMSGDSILLSSPPSASLPSTSTTTTSTPSKDLLERLAFSAGMARVTKLGVYEEQFDEFAEGVSDIPKLLQSVSCCHLSLFAKSLLSVIDLEHNRVVNHQ